MKISKNIKVTGIVIMLFICIAFGYFIFVNKEREVQKVDYTVEWKMKEGEISLSIDDKLYDIENKELIPKSQDSENSYYTLPKGVYKLLTKTIENNSIEIKIIVY